MKKRIKLFFAITILLAIGCQTEEILLENIIDVKTNAKQNRGNSLTTEELVILYPDGTTEADKVAKRLEYGVTKFKQCNCAYENLELWIFSNENGFINIEEKKITAGGDDGLDGADFNPRALISQNVLINMPTHSDINDAFPKIVPSNKGVTVAVLDTGIDYTYEGFSNPFLYNSKYDACTDNNSEEKFGWNFVDNNNNPFDDYQGKHGTIISNIITSNLESNNIKYQLLPVKVANKNGEIKYFDALCGFQYAVKKKNVRIVNMSFGWDNKELSLLNRFIKAVDKKIIVVTSAGNKTKNNDSTPHYPSSYSSKNILAMAGINENYPEPGLAYFSNYGKKSVDLAAISQNIPFINNDETYYVEGTSFSAAYGSFYSAYKFKKDMSAQDLKNTVIVGSIFSQNLQEIKFSAYIPE